MNDLLQAILGWCGPDRITGVGALPLLGLFLAGLGGGIAHCAAMCGPFVLGQVSEKLARQPAARLCEAHRLSAALLLPYHLGRLTTYAGLGAAGALASAGLGQLVWPAGLRALLLGLAALLFLTRALGALPWPARRAQTPGRIGRGLGWVASRAARIAPASLYLRGILLGFLPCGLLYAALVIAAATANVAAGALAMLVFGLGTVPSLAMVGLAGHWAGRRWHGALASFAPVIMGLNAALLGLLAWTAL